LAYRHVRAWPDLLPGSSKGFQVADQAKKLALALATYHADAA